MIRKQVKGGHGMVMSTSRGSDMRGGTYMGCLCNAEVQKCDFERLLSMYSTVDLISTMDEYQKCGSVCSTSGGIWFLPFSLFSSSGIEASEDG